MPALPTRFMPKASSKNCAALSGSGTDSAMWRSRAAMEVSLVELDRTGRGLARSILPQPKSVKRPKHALLRLNPGAHDDVVPLLEIGCDAIGELLRCARLGLDAELGQRVDGGAVVQDRIHF